MALPPRSTSIRVFLAVLLGLVLILPNINSMNVMTWVLTAVVMTGLLVLRSRQRPAPALIPIRTHDNPR